VQPGDQPFALSGPGRRDADGVGVQLLPPLDDASWVEDLRDTATALAELAQRAAQSYLEARPAGTFTVD